MKVVCDIECDSLDPTVVWVAVVKEVETGVVHIFLRPDQNPKELVNYAKRVSIWIGHNFLSFDAPVLNKLVPGLRISPRRIIDTLVVSRLVDYKIPGGHGLEDWGERVGVPKPPVEDFTVFGPHIVHRCTEDVEINFKVYENLRRYIDSPIWKAALRNEHEIEIVCKELRDNGFKFDKDKADALLQKLEHERTQIEDDLKRDFPPRFKPIKEILPGLTKSGRIHRGDFRWLSNPEDIQYFTAGHPFTRIEPVVFDPASKIQVIDRLWEAGWKPSVKTKGYKDYLKTQRRNAVRDPGKLDRYKRYGWKLDDTNLETLPSVEEEREWLNNCRVKLKKDEKSTKEIITFVMLNGKEQSPGNTTIPVTDVVDKGFVSWKEITGLVLRTLNKWSNDKEADALFAEKSRNSWSITATQQGVFVDCSASLATDTWGGMRNTETLQKIISQRNSAKKLTRWLYLTGRINQLKGWLDVYNPRDGRVHGRFFHIGAWSHRMSHANPNMANASTEHEFRELWVADEGKLLLGCDAEGIQLRVLAHYIDDPTFTDALIRGDKRLGTDAHSLNARALGEVCLRFGDKARDRAKTFIYAFVLGASAAKIAEIFESSTKEAEEAVAKFIAAYPGLSILKQKKIPEDAGRGYFQGFDGRLVRCTSEHLMLAGYLQNGESCIMKYATQLWRAEAQQRNIWYKFVNFVHDEWQSVIDPAILYIEGEKRKHPLGDIQAQAITRAGELLEVKCPMAGEYRIGNNWAETH